MHPPKIQTFDVAAGINVDNKGFERVVDEFRETPFGLYMSRAMVGRPTSHWVESWLLPELGLCVTDWWWKPGHERDQDYYLDVCHIERGSGRWRLTDLYLDLVVRHRRETTVIDVDEYVAAAVRCSATSASGGSRSPSATAATYSSTSIIVVSRRWRTTRSR